MHRAGQIVTREELKVLVWGGETFVDFEQGLNFCIKQIRAALGDEADNPRFIETVPRRGYRFIAPVARMDPAPAAGAVEGSSPEPVGGARRSARMMVLMVVAGLVVLAGASVPLWLRNNQGAASPPTKSMIAVLPFENLSGDESQDYFADGFTEELIGQLGRTNPTHLGVIARTSTMAYKGTTKSAAEIGRELGVDHFVEGTLRRSGDRVRINAQLIRVSDQSHVWAEIYEGEIRDILRLQRDVGNAVVNQILSALSPPSPGATSIRAVDPAVYDLYLQGRFLWNKRVPDEMAKAAATFKEAVSLDPTFAPAWAGLADALLVESRSEALEAAERAIALDDRLAEAHSAKAELLLHMLRWDWAEEEFQRAIALDPSYAPARYFYAEFLVARGRPQRGIEEALYALALDPKSAIATHVAGVTMYYSGQFDAALPYFRKALELDPQHTWSHLRIGLVLEQQRAYDAAFAEFARSSAPLRSAYAYAAAGRNTEARRIVAEALASPDVEYQAYHLAGAFVGLGDYDAALEWLELALARQLHDVIFLYVDPRLEPLRGLPEYQDLVRRGGWE